MHLTACEPRENKPESVVIFCRLLAQVYKKTRKYSFKTHFRDLTVQQHFYHSDNIWEILTATWHFYVALQMCVQCCFLN